MNQNTPPSKPVPTEMDDDMTCNDRLGANEELTCDEFHKNTQRKDHINSLTRKLHMHLTTAIPDDTVHLCGHAPLQILSTNPDEVLRLAYDKLNTWPYSTVPTCWLRLYEDASLYKALLLLRSQSDLSRPCIRVKKRKRLDGSQSDTSGIDWIGEIVQVLDKGLTLSGAPGRKGAFEMSFQHLGTLIENDYESIPSEFKIHKLPSLETMAAVARASEPLNFEAFQAHLDQSTEPLIIPDALSHWPAMYLWRDPKYLLRLTLGGRRLVPIEVGATYTDEAWGQRFMAMREFMDVYLLPEHPKEVGYLAQHDLFTQIPALRDDILVPDYCFTSPPPADAEALNTAGLRSVGQLEQPLLNAWFGPTGTRTPLHTDPYHNVLCQAVGYKYVRLYAPSETPRLYPLGVDEKGISMENTSRVDFSYTSSESLAVPRNGDGVEEMEESFPLFKHAKYLETILAPGECLYIPLGWWHYVESLTTSFSVSFWWN